MARTPSNPSEAQVTYAVIAKNGLNLRDAPNGAILGTLTCGVKVTMVSESGSWMNVKTKIGSGWVMSKYLERKK